METLFIVFAFIGMFASGFFACMLICFGMVMFKQDEQLKKRNKKNDPLQFTPISGVKESHDNK